MKYKQIRIGVLLCFFISVGTIMAPETVVSQEQRGGNVTAPDDEMRSSIHSVDG